MAPRPSGPNVPRAIVAAPATVPAARQITASRASKPWVTLGRWIAAAALLAGAAIVVASAARAVETKHATAGAQVDQVEVPVPVPSEKALRFHRTGNVLFAAATLWALALPFGAAFSGFGATLRNAVGRLARGHWLATVTLYGAAWSALGMLAVSGVLAAVYPSWRSASLPIATTLRREAVG